MHRTLRLHHAGVIPVAFAVAVAITPSVAPAQIIRDPRGAPAALPPEGAAPASRASGRQAQAEFEEFRRANLPTASSGPPGTCDEQVGRFCYWYDEKQPALPKEPAIIAARRTQLIALLDTLALNEPADQWVAGQRVRYLAESGRMRDALAAARACTGGGWVCDALTGFSFHLLGEYPAAESVYNAAIAKMLSRDRCDWRSIELLIDDDTKQQYRRLACDDPERRKMEDRAWFFARTLYSMPANDSRTEYFARMTMAMMLSDAPGLYEYGFDADERELLLRFGWPREWAIVRAGLQMSMIGPGMGGRGGRGGGGGGGGGRGGRGGGLGRGAGGRGGRGMPGGRGDAGREGDGSSIVGHEPQPAYRYIPPGFVLNNPPLSDSSAWRLQLPPVIARYAPPYAVFLKPLEHQKALFRRGDSAFVVLAYDARTMPELTGARINAALVVATSDAPRDFAAISRNAPGVGVLTVKAPWGPLLMSAEVASAEKQAVARARYGLTPPYAVGARVTLSDLLFYTPYGTFPASAEEAAPHAIPTERLRADEKLGVYWESYGTDPTGEKMGVSLTVVREVVEEPSFFRRQAKALGLVHEATPVVISVQDMSARASTTSARALEVDISTLKKGSYIVQLEIAVAGQMAIRAEHRIEVVGP